MTVAYFALKTYPLYSNQDGVTGNDRATPGKLSPDLFFGRKDKKDVKTSRWAKRLAVICLLAAVALGTTAVTAALSQVNSAKSDRGAATLRIDHDSQDKEIEK